jgi:hypothetical protein
VGASVPLVQESGTSRGRDGGFGIIGLIKKQSLPLPHERGARAHILYWTFTVTVAVLRPNWLVA